MYNNAAAPASRGGSPTGVASLSSELQVLNFGLVTSWSMASARMPEGGARRERAKGLALLPFTRCTPRPSDHGTRVAPLMLLARAAPKMIHTVSPWCPTLLALLAPAGVQPLKIVRRSVLKGKVFGNCRACETSTQALLGWSAQPPPRGSAGPPLTARRPWPEPTTSASPSAEPARRRRLSLAPGSSPAAPRWSGIAGW
jgi:hypothetical protein